MIESWERIDHLVREDYRVFRIHEERSRSPQTGQEHTFYVINAPDWVNVIPLTPEGQIVFVRQYRHGTKEVTLEVPGGMVDRADASPAAAARREMREETGYDTDDLIDLGAVAPNPAIQNNRCHSFLARGVRRVGPQRLEGAEDIDVTFVDPDDVPGLIVNGTINHALVVVAFYLYDQYRCKQT